MHQTIIIEPIKRIVKELDGRWGASEGAVIIEEPVAAVE